MRSLYSNIFILDDVVFQLREVFAQVGHRFIVDLHHLERTFLAEQELREHTHARSYLQDGQAGAGIDGVGDVLRYLQILQEMLAQKFLWLD